MPTPQLGGSIGTDKWLKSKYFLFQNSNCQLILMGDRQRDFGLEKYLIVGFALFESVTGSDSLIICTTHSVLSIHYLTTSSRFKLCPVTIKDNEPNGH